MAGIAAGLALSGHVPFMSTFGIFATGRCWEQIRTSICYPRANVKVVATHCGLSVGPDGATHQALEDVAIMRALPEMTVIVPCDAHETYAATLAMAEYDGPCYMRMGRSAFPVVKKEGCRFRIGRADTLIKGSDLTIVACGQMVCSCISAVERLEKAGISAELINLATVKPLDRKRIIASARRTGAVLTVEEHSIIGGLGSAVAECLSESCPVPMMRIGTKDVFGQSGEADELLGEYGLGVTDIVSAARKLLKARK